MATQFKDVKFGDSILRAADLPHISDGSGGLTINGQNSSISITGQSSQLLIAGANTSFAWIGECGSVSLGCGHGLTATLDDGVTLQFNTQPNFNSGATFNYGTVNFQGSAYTQFNTQPNFNSGATFNYGTVNFSSSASIQFNTYPSFNSGFGTQGYVYFGGSGNIDFGGSGNGPTENHWGAEYHYGDVRFDNIGKAVFNTSVVGVSFTGSGCIYFGCGSVAPSEYHYGNEEHYGNNVVYKGWNTYYMSPISNANVLYINTGSGDVFFGQSGNYISEYHYSTEYHYGVTNFENGTYFETGYGSGVVFNGSGMITYGTLHGAGPYEQHVGVNNFYNDVIFSNNSGSQATLNYETVKKLLELIPTT